MSDQQSTSDQQDPDAAQHPHTPGQDPRGSGQPREPGGHTGAPQDNPEHNTAPDGLAGARQGAPLGGDETTEEQLQADTAVEQDALKGLDPDDSPA